MKQFILLLLTCSALAVSAQKKARLLAGPVVGSVTPTTARVWLAYRGRGENAVILGDTAEHRVHLPVRYSYITNRKKQIAITFDYTGLHPGHKYNVLISIGGWGTQTRYSFQTPLDTSVADFSFLTGSCALMTTGLLRPLFPGPSNLIFRSMRRQQRDFMLWLGDNLYYFGKQHTSYDRMFARHLQQRRRFVVYKKFLSSQPNYAIWDDHDYGPNNSDRHFELKDSSLKVFKGFWPNTYPESPNLRGNYFSFRYYDAEFFMLDDRYHRDHRSASSPRVMGEEQMAWLKNKLLLSDATFKFIALGTQLLNTSDFDEEYLDFPEEREELLSFLAARNIPGVIFLTGDKHFSEVNRLMKDSYPIVEFSCSPLTSPVLPRKLLRIRRNETCLPGMDFGHKNFGRVAVSGEPGNRVCTIEIRNRYGKLKRTVSFSQNELRRQ